MADSKSLVHLYITGLISQITTSANIATLGGQVVPTSDDGADRGIVFNWNNGTIGKTGFYGFQRATGKFAFLSDVTVTNGVYSGNPATILATLQGNVTGNLTGNVTGNVTGAVTGNADTATRATSAANADNATSAATAVKLTTARNIAISGDLTWNVTFDGTGPVSAAGTLAASGVTAGTYNSATQIVPITFDAKGRATATGTAVTIAPLFASIASKPTTLAGYGITDVLVKSATVTTGNGVSGTVTGTTALAFAFTLGAITPSSVASTGALSGTTIGGTTITASVGLVGAGSGITALNATNLASGTVPIARLGTGTPSATTYLAGDNSWKTTPLGSVTAVTVTTGNGVSATVTNQGTTPTLAFSLGDITPTSVVSSGAISGTTGAFSGAVTGVSFTGAHSGSGAGLTNLAASALVGTIATANLGTGTASATTYLAGDGTWKTTPLGSVTAVSVASANGVSGTSSGGATPALTISLGAITPTSVTATGAVSGSTLAGAGSAITALNASNLASGTVPLAQIGTGTPSATTYLAGDNSWKAFPTLTNGTVTAVTVAAANGITGTVANQGTTPALTIVLGAITPTSINTSGIVTASGFSGSGSGLSALPAAALIGTIPTTNLGSGTASATTYLAGDQTWKTTPLGSVTTMSVVSANGVSGTVANPTTAPAITLTLGAITPSSVAASGALSGTTIGGTTITASVGLVGPGSGITALNASNLASGTVATARLGTGTASATTILYGDGTWKAAPVPNAGTVTAVTVTAANGVSAAVATQGSTPALTFSLGDITPTSVTASGNGSFGGLLSVTGVISAAGATFNGTTMGYSYVSNGPTTAMYALLATLPASTSATYDQISIQATLNDNWFATGNRLLKILLSNRGGFTGKTLSCEGGNLPTGVRIQAYTQSNGTVQVWLTLAASSFTTTSLNVIGSQQASVVSSPVMAATAPTGTLSYDSNTATALYLTDGSSTFNVVALTATGAINGASFTGVGTALTALNASNLASGTVPIAQLGSSGTPSATTYLAGDNTWKTTPVGTVTAVSVATANGVSGSSSGGATPALTIVLGAITPTSVAATGAVSGSTLAGAGSAITALNASNLGSGTVPVARLGSSGTPSATTYLAGDNTWKTTPVPNAGTVTAVTVTAANGVSATVANQGSTPAFTFVLGDITPTSVTASGNGSFGGTLTVTGATNITGALTSGGTITGLALAVTNNSNMGGTLTVTGVATAGGFTTTAGVSSATVTASGLITGGSFSGVGTALTALNASNLTSGTVAPARLGSGTASASTFLTGASTYATAVTSLSVATANGISGTVNTSPSAPIITLVLGDITPSSVTSSGIIQTTSNISAQGSVLGAAFVPITGTVATGITGMYSGGSNVLSLSTGGTERLRLDATGLTTVNNGATVNGALTINDSISYSVNAVSASQIDCSLGVSFTKTAVGVNTWTAINVPASGLLYEFELEITNGGLGTQTWMPNTKWPGGVIPTLTVSGVDILVFRTRDGGATWRGIAVSINSL